MSEVLNADAIRKMAISAVAETKVTDVHTHIYTSNFKSLLLWGIDELLTYHYLVAETMRRIDIPYSTFWKMAKRDQADLIWDTLFLSDMPTSEACRGVLTVLERLGLDVSSRDLQSYRRFFEAQKVDDYIDRVFQVAGVETVVMTNDPFDKAESAIWLERPEYDSRFLGALRLGGLLNDWRNAVHVLNDQGYAVNASLDAKTVQEVRRFLREWLDRIKGVYMAVSLPPTFAFPGESIRSLLMKECVLNVAAERGIPLALMIGVKKLVNPDLKVGGDSVGKGDISAVETLCACYPENKFMVTMLSRENQHELCVAARKFRNLMPFGCWWFLNNPSLIEEMTRMRLELLGGSFIPQHSDARVLDQLIYKWDHSRKIIGKVLADKYVDLASTGWQVSEKEIKRDVNNLFADNFSSFAGRKLK